MSLTKEYNPGKKGEIQNDKNATELYSRNATGSGGTGKPSGSEWSIPRTGNPDRYIIHLDKPVKERKPAAEKRVLSSFDD